MNIFIKNLSIFTFWIFIFILLVLNGSRYLDPDFGWHLRVGKNIAETKTVPDIEYFDYTLEGRHWVDHEWFLNYFSFIVFENFGYFSLIIFFAAIALLVFYLLSFHIYLKNKKQVSENFINKILLFILIALGVYASLPHLGVRMQEFTLLYLLFLMIILNKFQRTKNPKLLLFLPLLFFLWANSHAGFLIGLVLVSFWVLLKSVEYISFKYYPIFFINYKNVFSRRDILTAGLFIPFSFLATLVSPYGIKLYEFLTTYSSDSYLKVIVEWFPFYFLPIQYFQLLYISIAVTVFLIVFVLVFLNKKKGNTAIYKFHLWDLGIFFLFMYLALKSRRHFPLFFIVSLPMVYSLHLFLFKNSFNQLKKIINLRIASFFIISVVLIFSVNNAFKINFVTDPFKSFCSSYPCGAIEFLKQNNELQEKRMFNNYGWGGTLVWALPKMKLFLDGRLPQVEYMGHSILEEYGEFYTEEKVKEKLDLHNIEMVFLKNSFAKIKLNWFERYFLMLNEDNINSKKNYLEAYLKDSNEWEKVYFDKNSSIYVKI